MAFLATLSVVLAMGCRSEHHHPRLILLVGIDTLRADHLGIYGYPKPTSPNIDALSRRGVVFDRAFSTSSWTVPAVASVLTSRYPSEHGAGEPGEIKNLGKDVPTQIRAGLPMLAEAFRRAGFSTALFSANPFLYGRFRDGFDVASVEREDGEKTVDRALAWLATDDSRPRFLYVHLMDVHPPNRFSAQDAALFRTRMGVVPSLADGDWHGGWDWPKDVDDPHAEELREVRVAAYDAAIRYDDFQVGRLLSAIAARGLLRDTLVLLFADHGEEFWDHAAKEHSWGDDPRGLYGVGHGQTLFDELLHVPLVVAGPNVSRGVRSECLADLLDIAPTLAAGGGVDPEAGWRGIDLATLPRATAECRPRLLFASSPAYGPSSVAVLMGPLKLYRRGHRADLLFDLRSDPGERDDLASSRPPWGERLRRLAGTYQSSALPMGPASKIEDPALLRSLRALGYL